MSLKHRWILRGFTDLEYLSPFLVIVVFWVQFLLTCIISMFFTILSVIVVLDLQDTTWCSKLCWIVVLRTALEHIYGNNTRTPIWFESALPATIERCLYFRVYTAARHQLIHHTISNQDPWGWEEFKAVVWKQSPQTKWCKNAVLNFWHRTTSSNIQTMHTNQTSESVEQQ